MIIIEYNLQELQKYKIFYRYETNNRKTGLTNKPIF